MMTTPALRAASKEELRASDPDVDARSNADTKNCLFSAARDLSRSTY